jgi:glycine cleavage system H protein
MLAILTLLTFALFITLDYVLTRKEQARRARLPTLTPTDLGPDVDPAHEPVWVAGYQLPEHLHYHRGHSWARVLSPDVAVVGVDDFARRLMGRTDAVSLPHAGDDLVQGGQGFALKSGPRAAAFVSPVGGKVLEVNPELVDHPELCNDDPYGRGWLFKVRTSQLAANLRNLLDGRLARRWIEDARSQLELRLMVLSGSVLQDGGEPAPDFAEHLPPEDWNGLAETFLGSASRPRAPSTDEASRAGA